MWLYNWHNGGCITGIMEDKIFLFAKKWSAIALINMRME